MKCFCLTAVICCSSLSVSAGTVQRPLHSCLPAMFRTRTSSTTHSTPPPRTNPHSSLTPPSLLPTHRYQDPVSSMWFISMTNRTQPPAQNNSPLCQHFFCTEKLRKSPPNSEFLHLEVLDQRKYIFKSFSAQKREQTWREKAWQSTKINDQILCLVSSL